VASLRVHISFFLLASSIVGCSTPQSVSSVSTSTKDSVTCNLPLVGDSYKGSCTVTCSVNALAVNFDGLEAKRVCTGPLRRVSAEIKKIPNSANWIGTMQGVQPEDPTRFEMVANVAAPSQKTSYVGRTPFGWFAIETMEQTATGLFVSMNADRQVRPTKSDIAIITRALELIPNENVWNKNDNRQCPAGQIKLSLFCALQNATTEISGGVHYRQPALQAVREVLNTVDAKRIKTHRIMDYNNHPETTLSEIHAVLRNAQVALLKDIR
jgi:hypothetical protein